MINLGYTCVTSAQTTPQIVVLEHSTHTTLSYSRISHTRICTLVYIRISLSLVVRESSFLSVGIEACLMLLCLAIDWAIPHWFLSFLQSPSSSSFGCSMDLFPFARDQVLRGHSLSVSLCSSESLLRGWDHLFTSRVFLWCSACMDFTLIQSFAPCLDIAASMPLFAAFSPIIEFAKMFNAGTSSSVSYSRGSVRPSCQSWRQVEIFSVVVVVCRIVDQVRPPPVHGHFLQSVKGLIIESGIRPVRQPVRLSVRVPGLQFVLAKCQPLLFADLSSCRNSSLRAKQSLPSLIVKSLANLLRCRVNRHV